MALPTTGPLSLSQVNVELGRSSTAQISMGDSIVRTLFERPSGAISMQDGRGKANVFAFNIVSNVTNANLRTLALNAGWNGTTKVEATINSGVTISGNTAGNSTAAMTINGSFPNGVELVNNGVIVGRGGNGGNGGNADGGVLVSVQPSTTNGTDGSAGGRALLVQVPVSIRNNGEIRGGGGGGAGGTASAAWIRRKPFTGACTNLRSAVSGAGGGGGRSSLSNSSGGSNGVISSSVGTASQNGGVGGAGTLSGAGSRGTRALRITDQSPADCPNIGSTLNILHIAGHAGNGGNWGASGGNAESASLTPNTICCPAHTQAIGSPRVGGAAGQAVNGNSNITWLATGTRSGPIV